MSNVATERRCPASSSRESLQYRPDPHHLRALVHDYLCHYSYADTALALTGDSYTSKDPQNQGSEWMQLEEDVFKGETLKQMRLRREIRQNIISGRTDRAINLISEHFPSTIRTASESAVHQSAGIGHSRIHYNSQTSVNPAHISLNLNILSFIELSRTMPLEYPPNPNDTSKRFDYLDNAELRDKHLAEQIRRAQSLHDESLSLPDPADKSIYQDELKNVISLLVYPEPESSPIAKYLSQERRDAVAEQVNSAILHQLKRPAVSYLELYMRYLTAVWSFIHDMKIKIPASYQPLLNNLPTNMHSQGKAADSFDKEQPDEITTPFSLRDFLDSTR